MHEIRGVGRDGGGIEGLRVHCYLPSLVLELHAGRTRGRKPSTC